MLKNDHELYTGNDKFEGFAVDMVQLISTMLKFKYDLYVVPDGNFGVQTENGEWNGIIGEILSGVFHLLL